MSYTVLARKYRSGTFDEIVGQEQVARTLKRAIETDRIAHAFLFCGTRGVGKTSMARILAKALNCEKFDKPTATPCLECPSCKAIKEGQDLDVIEIDAASNTQVEKVRDLIENCRFRPARARFKVYIIDEVHMLSRGAFNALLKTLEEPPSHVKFILATTETEKVPATILSRCQRYDFRNIPTREIAAHLKQVCKQEKVKADEDALFLIARAGAGSMRDALSLLDRLLSIGEKSLTAEQIEQMLGMPKAQVIFDLAQAIGEGETKKVLHSADKIIREGLSPESLVGALAEHLRNLLIVATCGKDSELVEVAGLSIDDLAKQASQFDTVALTQSVAILEELRRGLRGATVGRALLDATLVRLTLADQFTRVEDLLAGTAAAPPVQKKKLEVTLTPRRGDPAPPRAPGDDSPPRELDPTIAVTAAPSSTDDDDALPAVGRVYDGPTRSLGAIMSSARRSPIAPPAPRGDALEPVEQGEFASVMQNLRAALNQHGPGFDGLLVDGRIVSLENGQAVIRYRHEHQSMAQMLERNGKREKVQEVLAELLNAPVGLRIEIEPPADQATPSPPPAPMPRPVQSRVQPAAAAQTPAPPPAAPPPTAEQKQQVLQSDPLVRAACEMFNGEIVRIEP